MRWISTTFKTSEKSTALDFIFLVACNLLHEIKNPHIREMAFDVKSVVHQDARYQKCRSVFTNRYCVWKKSGIVDVENDVRSYIGSICERAGYSINLWATSCAVWNLSCIKMHATKNADRYSLIGIVFERYYRIICVLFFVKRLFLTLLEGLKFH